jgi:hypothetical protein
MGLETTVSAMIITAVLEDRVFMAGAAGDADGSQGMSLRWNVVLEYLHTASSGTNSLFF